MTGLPACRSCGAADLQAVLDLGAVPEGSTLAPTAGLAADAPTWPLRSFVCGRCLLLQLDDAGPEESSDGAGAAAYTSPTLERQRAGLVDAVMERLAGQATATDRPPRLLEVASHSGYVQPAFEARGLRTLIAESSADRADAARADGRSVVRPVGDPSDPGWLLEAAGGPVDVVIDEFLLAHLRAPSALLVQVRNVLAPGGFAVFELADVRPTIEQSQFDSFRHGHFAYFSMQALEHALRRVGMTVFDVQALPIYGGSLRVWAQASGARPVEPSVARWLDEERRAGLDRIATYAACRSAVDDARRALRAYLDDARREGRTLVAYGAPSRAATLLAAGGVTSDDVLFTVDRSAGKQGSFLPGSAVPVRSPADLVAARPDDVLILTWDLAAEVVAQLPEVAGWGGRFVVPIPELRVVAGPPLPVPGSSA